MNIITIQNKKNEKFLRQKVKPLDFQKENKKALKELLKEMRKTLKGAKGVGLSANQLGISKRLFIAEAPLGEEISKFYTIINPEIIKFSKESSTAEEGCLSIPKTFGQVLRPEKITIKGMNLQGKKIKLKVWGLLARIFQHEVDHLNGILFIDKAKNIVKEETHKP